MCNDTQKKLCTDANCVICFERSFASHEKSIFWDGEKNEEPINYWYNPDTGVVYDYDLNYPIGKIKYDENDIPIKLDKSIYKIEIIHVPLIKNIK